MGAVRTARVGPLLVDAALGTAWWGPCRLDLTPGQFRMLSCLAGNAGFPVPWRQVLSHVHGIDWPQELGPGSLHVLACRLRAALEAGGAPRGMVATVRGVGYLLSQPAASARTRPGGGLPATARLEAGCVAWVSAEFTGMLGWPAGEVLGWRLDRLLGTAAAAAATALHPVEDAAEPRMTAASALRSDGRLQPVVVVSWPALPGMVMLLPH